MCKGALSEGYNARVRAQPTHFLFFLFCFFSQEEGGRCFCGVNLWCFPVFRLMRLRGPACNNTIKPERLAFTHWFFATTSATTDDVLDESKPERDCGDTPHTYTCMKKYYTCRYCALPWFLVAVQKLPWFLVTVQKLPWFLVTVQKLPWWPVTVQKLLCITVVSGYRTNITVMASYREKIIAHYRGGWLPR